MCSPESTPGTSVGNCFSETKLASRAGLRKHVAEVRGAAGARSIARAVAAGKSIEKEAGGWRGVFGIEQKDRSSGLRGFWKAPDCSCEGRWAALRRGITSGSALNLG